MSFKLGKTLVLKSLLLVFKLHGIVAGLLFHMISVHSLQESVPTFFVFLLIKISGLLSKTSVINYESAFFSRYICSDSSVANTSSEKAFFFLLLLISQLTIHA